MDGSNPPQQPPPPTGEAPPPPAMAAAGVSSSDTVQTVHTASTGDASSAAVTMGGTPGDGVLQQPGASGMPAPTMLQPPQPNVGTPTNAAPPAAPEGSITRFATPEIQNQYFQATQQQQQQQVPYGQGSPFANQAASSPTSFAARSAQAHQQQQQQNFQPSPPVNFQPQPMMNPTTTGAMATPPRAGAGSFAARSAQAHQQAAAAGTSPSVTVTSTSPQQASPNVYASGGYGATPPRPIFGQQQQPAYGTPQPTSPPQVVHQQHAPPSPAYSQQTQPSGYAPQPTQSNVYTQQPAAQPAAQQPSYSAQQPTQSSSSNMSFAQRSAARMQQPSAIGGGVGPVSHAAVVPSPVAVPSPSTAATPRTGAFPSPSSAASPAAQQPSYQQQSMQQPAPPAPMPQGSGQGGGVPQQQPSYQQQSQQQPSYQQPTPMPGMATAVHAHHPGQNQQERLLTDATRKVQEHAYYMHQAMDRHDLPTVLDRAASMVGELGATHHHHHGHHGPDGKKSHSGASSQLTPKNYYELYMRALEDMPSVQEYLYNLGTSSQPSNADPNTIQVIDTSVTTIIQKPYTMRDLYECVQYCPRVVSRLYLQITTAAALLASGEAGARWVLNDIGNAIKCEQNPTRGLFLRHYVLQALKDKLPDGEAPPGSTIAPTLASVPSEEELNVDNKVTDSDEIDIHDPGTVKDSYEFVLANFMEMNKLWVRLQHLPGEGRNKEVKKRRERERNELRILVGTNLVRLSQLEGVTSKIYGEVILPKILDHIVVCGDPLSQAYLMDCLVQVFPDEYHIETLPILLNVCPRLRDKVNIRTILQGLMDRLANYLADEELLDESDTNQVKKTLARDSFGMFEECVQRVFNARGPKLSSKEVIRLQTALLQFSLRCYEGNMEQVNRCLGVCSMALRQANASYEAHDGTVAPVPTEKVVVKPLDEASVVELEKLLSIPLDSLALQVLELVSFSELLSFLPWTNRRQVAVSMLQAVDKSGTAPQSVKEIQELFSVIEPVIRDEQTRPASAALQDPTSQAANLMAGLGVSAQRSMSFGASPNESDPGRLKDAAKLNALVSKLVHLLDHEDVDVVYEFLCVARTHICTSDRQRAGQMLISVVFAALRLARRVFDMEQGTTTAVAVDEGSPTEQQKTEAPSAENAEASKGEEESEPAEKKDEEEVVETVADDSPNKEEGEDAVETVEKENGEGAAEEEKVDPSPADENATSDGSTTKTKSITCRKVFVFLQETISLVGKSNPEWGVKLYLESALTADRFATVVKPTATVSTDYVPIAYELLSQAYALYEETVAESKVQHRCITAMAGTLLALRSLSKDDYESLVTKTAQFSAKVMKKTDQCELVAFCAHLFYPISQGDEMKYSNPQRALECLQRSLKLADGCTSTNPSNVYLFVDLLEQYVYFFENGNPAIKDGYITGLIALVKEHLSSLNSLSSEVSDAKAQFVEVVRYIKQRKAEEATADLFAPIQVG